MHDYFVINNNCTGGHQLAVNQDRKLETYLYTCVHVCVYFNKTRVHYTNKYCVLQYNYTTKLSGGRAVHSCKVSCSSVVWSGGLGFDSQWLPRHFSHNVSVQIYNRATSCFTNQHSLLG